MELGDPRRPLTPSAILVRRIYVREVPVQALC